MAQKWVKNVVKKWSKRGQKVTSRPGPPMAAFE
jgi:hypothetical protein